MKQIARALLLLFMSLVLPAQEPTLSLMQTYEKYTRSIQQRDMNGMFETVSDHGIDFIDTKGRLTTTLDEYRAYHREWFADTGWSISFELQKKVEHDQKAYLLVIFHYKKKKEDGTEYSAKGYTTFLFRRENGQWKMVLDVCTPIR